MSAAPPIISRGENRAVMLVAGGVAVALAAVVFFFDPSRVHFYPVCLFHKCTGLECPGCGATRSLYALLHGNFRLAWHDNALLVALIILSAARGAWLLFNRLRGQYSDKILPGQWLWLLLAVTVVFGVLRNLPWFSFLSPD